MELSEHLFREAAAASHVHAEMMGVAVHTSVTQTGVPTHTSAGQANVPRGTPVSYDETKRLAGAVASMEHAVATIQGTAMPTESELRDILTKVSVAKSLVELVLDCRFYKDAK